MPAPLTQHPGGFPPIKRSCTEVLSPVDLSQRADLSEWMDEPCAYETFRDCLRSLARLNRLTLAYRPTLDFLTRLTRRHSPPRPLHILDVGSGYGDMLRRVHRWAAAHDLPVRLTGIDINPNSARAAAEATDAPIPAGSEPITYLTGDAFEYLHPPDIIFSSLVTHHLPSCDIPPFLSWMDRTARLGWFVNDLHRESIPYLLYGSFTKLLRFHPYVQHDGLISFRRAFRRSDWQAYLEAAGISADAARIVTYTPARLCIERIR